VCAAVNPPKTAADTFNRILALLKAGDIDAAAKYFNAPDPEMAEGLKRAANRLQSGQLTVTWVDSKEEGDLAVVIVKVVDADQGGEAGALYEANAMRRTDGTWRVYPTKRRAEATEKEGKGVAEGKPEAPPKPKKDVPPSLGEPDIKLEGADKEKMAVLWQWAQARCAELSKDSKKPPRPEVPPAGDVKQTKEWQALNRLVGSWEDQVTVTIPERKQGRWSITTAWILGDRFIQAKSQSDLDNSEAVSLYTYDLNRRVLRAWWFSSLGFSASFTGSWDEAASTFTFKVDDAGPGSSTVTSRFIDDDHREWKVITKDADGKVVYEMSGKSIRQKKPMEKPAPDGLAQPGNVDFKQTKEWKALNRLVGSWDYLVTFSNPKTNQGRISSTAAWTLGDRFLQFKSRRGNNIESMSLLTYDPNRGVIRWWYFSSLGQTTGFSGVWDETTNTFTFKEQETGPMTSISIDHFIDDDHRELKDIIKGPDGKVVFEMTYKGTRQKRTGQAPGKAQGAVNPPSAGAAGS
jgi:hypothetical protein